VKNSFVRLVALLALVFAPVASFASPISYTPSPFDTIQGVTASYNQTLNASLFPLAALSTATGTTAVTATGTRLQLSYTGLVTAASSLSAAQTVTDTSVAAASQVMCQTTGYAGTGIPVVVNIVPAAGSFTYNIQNVSTGAALNATVVVNCFVSN